jgi:hypothetical protein
MKSSTALKFYALCIILYFPILALLLSLCSCRTVKSSEIQSTVRDSIHLTHLQVVDTIKVKERIIEKQFSFDFLKQYGSLNIQGKGVNTEVRYINDSINVKTIVDSAQYLYLKTIIQKYAAYNSQNTNSTIKQTQPRSQWPWFIAIISITALIQITLIQISKWKKKSF